MHHDGQWCLYKKDVDASESIQLVLTDLKTLFFKITNKSRNSPDSIYCVNFLCDTHQAVTERTVGVQSQTDTEADTIIRS